MIDINARVGLGAPPCTAIALRAAAIWGVQSNLITAGPRREAQA